jgi:putative membrane protein
MMNLLIRLFVNAAALAVAAWLLGDIWVREPDRNDRIITLLVVAAIFGIVNAIIKPVLTVLTLPITILTLGLFIFVLNALMLMLTSWIAGQIELGFHVEGFWTAVIGAIIISIVSWGLNTVLPED